MVLFALLNKQLTVLIAGWRTSNQLRWADVSPAAPPATTAVSARTHVAGGTGPPLCLLKLCRILILAKRICQQQLTITPGDICQSWQCVPNTRSENKRAPDFHARVKKSSFSPCEMERTGKGPYRFHTAVRATTVRAVSVFTVHLEGESSFTQRSNNSVVKA